MREKECSDKKIHPSHGWDERPGVALYCPGVSTPLHTGNHIHCSGVHFWWTRPGKSSHNQVPISCADYVKALEKELTHLAGTDAVRHLKSKMLGDLDAQYRSTLPTSKSELPKCSMCKTHPVREKGTRFCKKCYSHLTEVAG